jgi:TonB family protein
VEFLCDGEVTDTSVLALRARARIFCRTLCKSIVAAVLLPLLIGSGCQGQSPKKSLTASKSSPSSPVGQDSRSITLEANRAVAILKQGIAEKWGDRVRYLSAFEKTPDVDSAGQPVTDAKSYVKCVIEGHFRNHEVWDEGVPIDAEARLTLIELIKLREYAEKATGSDKELKKFDLPPCVSSERSKILISAGVAAALLKTKVDPIYPADALQHNVSGTVTLRVTIDTDGHVAALKIISGPDELRQAAVDAVGQWMYKPYQLNGGPVEAETTVTIPFGLHQ